MKCPMCGAENKKARLEIIGLHVSGSFPLSENGYYNLSDDGTSETDEEMVFCHACKQVFSYDEIEFD